MKYLKLKHRGFVLFEETQSHKEIAQMLGDEVESAGFAHATEWCEDGKICCSGKSQTLGKECHETDTDRLRTRLSRC